MTKRALALLLVIAMVFSLLPVMMVSAAGEGYSVILQKAHNQTEGSLSVDVYLQANTADQGNVTGYQFTVTPGNGAQLTAAEDLIAQENIYSGENTETAEVTNDFNVIYNPAGENAVAIPVGTTRVRVATLTLQAAEGAELPASLIEAAGLSGIKITLGETGFYADVAPAEDAEDYASYKGAVTLSQVGYGCTDHTCGHGTGTWTPVTAAELSGKTLAAGNYYLVEDVSTTAKTTIAPAENAQVNICLNGYTWTSSATQMIYVDAPNDAPGATVNICDCTATGSGTGLVAGKIVPQKYNWGNLRVASKNTTLNVTNVVIEGAENALAYDKSNANVGNAAAFYSPTAATGSMIHVENVLIRNMNAKTVVDIRSGGHLKNVVFENCSGSRNDPANDKSDMLAIIANNGMPGADANVTIEDCRFVNCSGYVLDTEEWKAGNTYTLKGNVQAEGAFYVSKLYGLILDLGSEAKVTIETEENKTAETFGEAVTIPAGASLPEYALYYTNGKAFVSYSDGVFTLNGHVHEDGYAGISASHEWHPWQDPTTLPSEAGYYYLTTDVKLTAEAPVQSVHICLNGHTIDASAAPRVSKIWSYTRTFCDCKGHADPEKAGTLIGGTAKDGSLFWMRGRTATLRGSYLYLYDVKLTGNETQGSAPIYAEHSTKNSTKSNATLIMERVQAYGNHGGNGGVIQLQGVATADVEKYDNQVKITIRDCDFRNNTATSGGAIYLTQNPTVTIENSTFDGNNATTNGGAVYVYTSNTAKNVLISGCTFTNNTSVKEAGALRLANGAAVTVADSTFTGNTSTNSGGGAIYTVTAATSLTLDNCKITGNTDAVGGGGVYMTSANTTLILSGDTVIAGNTTVGKTTVIQDLFYQQNNEWTTPLMKVNNLGEGAHINAYYSHATAAVNVVAEGEDEKDASELVAIADVEGAAQAPFSGQISYAKNSTDGVKTVSYMDLTADDGQDNPTFTYGHYHKNAQGEYYELTAWTSKTALPSASGNYYLANNVKVSAAIKLAANTNLCLCINGRTVTGGAAQAYRVTSAATTGVKMTLEDCTATHDENGHFVSGGKFTGFSKAGNGCVLQFYNGDIQISGIAFTNNADSQYLYANCTNSTRGFGGGAIQTRGANSLTLKIDGCKFEGNSSGSDGGAIVSQAGQHYISNTVFEGNTAHRSGGAIMMCDREAMQGKPTLDLTNCKFEGNHAYGTLTAAGATTTLANTARGGAVYTISTTVNVTGCEFTGNTAGCQEGMTTASDVGLGGAIMVLNPGTENVTITDTVFKENIAETNGGALYTQAAPVTATNVTMEGNTAGAAGALYVKNTDLTINGGAYTGNSATNTGDGGGGGALRTNGTVNVTVKPYNGQGTAFRQNKVTAASASGGAILVSTGTVLDIDGAVIEDNSAANGAALTLWGSSDTRLHNTTVQYNKSSSTAFGNVFFGGTGSSDKCRLTVSGVTVIDNNTNADGTVECNLVIRDSIAPLILIGEGGLEAGSSIGVNARPKRFTEKGYFHITGDLNGTDPTQYFTSDNSGYAVAKINDKLPTYAASGTAKPTTHDAGIAAQAAVAAAQEKVASGEYYEIVTGTSKIAADGTHEETTYTYLIGYVADSAEAVDYLAFVAAMVGNEYYHTVADAITAAGAEGTVVLQADVNADMNAAADLKIDLNGHDIQKLTMAKDTTVSLIDSKTNDYDVADGDCGTVKVEGEGKVAPYAEFITGAGKLRRYMTLTDENGVSTAHRIYLAINTKVLRTANRGVGFKAIYGGDQMIVKAIEDGKVQFGMLLTLDNTADKNQWLYGDFSASGFTSGKYATGTPNQKTAVIMSVLDPTASDNQARADATIYGVPCIAINNEVVAVGAEIQTSLSELAKDALANGTEEIKTTVQKMLTDFGVSVN